MKHKLLLFLLLLGLLAGCKPKAEQSHSVLTVSIEPLRYFTEAIAGERFSVVTMVPKGSSPESYDPTPRQLIDLAQSRAYLNTGYLGFDLAWNERLRQNAPDVPFFNLSEGIDFIEPIGNYHESEEHHHHHHHGGVEPHIWNSPQNASVMVENLCRALCSIDTEGAEFYTARRDSLLQSIARTDSLLCERLSMPEADRAFMIYHPALSYFARDYGLRQISIEEEGKEPSPAQLKELIDLCKQEGVRVIFVQPEFDRRNAEIIARQTNTRVVPINPLAYDWEEELMRTAAALTVDRKLRIKK